MSDEAQITATEYDPDDKLRSHLHELFQNITLKYGEKEDYSVELGEEDYHRDYYAEFDGYELSGFETYSAFGSWIDLRGHLGFASAVMLGKSTQSGAPTQSYVGHHKEAPPPDRLSEDPYNSLTTEWHSQYAVRQGFSEMRLESGGGQFDTTPIGLGELERYARVWLSAAVCGN